MTTVDTVTMAGAVAELQDDIRRLTEELKQEQRINAAYRATMIQHGLSPEQVHAITKRAIYGEDR